MGNYAEDMSNTAVTHPIGLRAKERVIKRLADGGMSDPEIAWRFRCSPGHIQRILQLVEVPRPSRRSTDTAATTPLERTVLKARNRGATHAEIAARMRRSPDFVARVEQFAALRPLTKI
jgi:DNA-binding CsgD family transcriptional regulator